MKKIDKEKDFLKDEELGTKLIKKSFWLYIISYLIIPSGYLIKTIISNSVDIADVGVIYAVIGLITLISSYNDIGMTTALNYYLPKYWIQKKYDAFKTSMFITLFFQIISSVVIIIILFFGADWLATHYFQTSVASQVLKIFCIYFLVFNIFQVIQSVYLSFQDAFYTKLIEFIKRWAIVFFVSMFFLLDAANIMNYTLSWLYGVSFAVFISLIIFIKKYLFVLKKGTFKREKDTIKEFLNYSIWSFLGKNANILLRTMDLQMIIFFLGPIQAGYFTNFISLMEIPVFLLMPIIAFMLPIISELNTKNLGWKLKILQNILYKYFTVFSIALGGILFVLGPILASILFGTKFMYSGVLLQYIILFIFLRILTNINYQILGGINKIKQRTKIILISFVFNLLANIPLILRIGPAGAIISTIIGWYITFQLSFNIVNKNEPVQIAYKYIFKNVIFIALLNIVVYLIKDSIFILLNKYRYTNLLRFVVIFAIYALLISIFNYKDLIKFKNQIMKLRKN